MIYYSYNDFISDMKSILPTLSYNNFDAIVVIARGGSTMGHFLAEALNIRKMYSINSVHYDDTKKMDTITITNIPDLSKEKKVLILDDICDSGDTLDAVVKIFDNKFPNTTFKTMTIFYKESAMHKPDFKIRLATDWINFFWVNDLKEEK